MAVNSESLASAPRFTIFEMVSFQAACPWRKDVACSREWHLLQTRVISALPGPSGRLAAVSEAAPNSRAETQTARAQTAERCKFSFHMESLSRRDDFAAVCRGGGRRPLHATACGKRSGAAGEFAGFGGDPDAFAFFDEEGDADLETGFEGRGFGAAA